MPWWCFSGCRISSNLTDYEKNTTQLIPISPRKLVDRSAFVVGNKQVALQIRDDIDRPAPYPLSFVVQPASHQGSLSSWLAIRKPGKKDDFITGLSTSVP